MECGKGGWVKNLAKCIGDFEWQDMGGDAIKHCLEEGEQHVDEGVVGETKAGDDERNCGP